MTLRHRLYGIGHKDLRRAHKLWAVVYRACARTSPLHHVTGSWLASPWTAVISYSSQKHCYFGDGPTPLSGHENLTFKWPRRRQRGPFCFRLNFWEAWKKQNKKNVFRTGRFYKTILSSLHLSVAAGAFQNDSHFSWITAVIRSLW